MLNFHPPNKTIPAKGRLLVSYPLMRDAHFERVVILLCEHNERGSFGLVLNRYLSSAEAEQLQLPRVQSNRVSLGGPVDTEHAYLLHSFGEQVPGCQAVQKGVYFGGDFDRISTLYELPSTPAECLRYFVGYSGWSSGQLHEEIAQHYWYVAEAGAVNVMDTSEDHMWERAFQSLGPAFAHLLHAPRDPSLN